MSSECAQANRLRFPDASSSSAFTDFKERFAPDVKWGSLRIAVAEARNSNIEIRNKFEFSITILGGPDVVWVAKRHSTTPCLPDSKDYLICKEWLDVPSAPRLRLGHPFSVVCASSNFEFLSRDQASAIAPCVIVRLIVALSHRGIVSVCHIQARHIDATSAAIPNRIIPRRLWRIAARDIAIVNQLQTPRLRCLRYFRRYLRWLLWCWLRGLWL